MLLGVEALIFERISIRPTAKLPKFFNGLYEKSLTDSFALDSRAQLQPFGLNPQVSNPQISNPRQSEFLFSNASSIFRVLDSPPGPIKTLAPTPIQCLLAANRKQLTSMHMVLETTE